MLNRIIRFVLDNQLLVVILFTLTMVWGGYALWQLPVDAFPDTTPVQVQINTTAPALSPVEIEQQITMPVEWAISGLPGLLSVRSISKFGLSQVVATFSDDINIYDARQFITERIAGVELPDGIERPELGPISTGLGEVFHYIVRSDNPERTLDELRTLHDWVIKPELRKVPGVAEINAWGGHERQYQVIVSPKALVKYRLEVDQIKTVLQSNNANVGGGIVTTSGQDLLVQGVGRVVTVEHIENIVIRAAGGVPVRIKDVATVQIGHEIRRGAVTAHGQGEVVLGLGFMLMGENSQDVTIRLKERLEAIRPSLPPDVIVETVYDRTELVDHVIDTVKENLLFGAILVLATLFLLLNNLRAGLITALAIPMAMLFAVLGMTEMSIAASLLSLGAIDFGIIIDGSIVMTENNMRRLAQMQRKLGRILTAPERLQSIITSSQEVARPIVFGLGIIALVFVPVLTLEGIEGKMFQPMAWTFIFAMIGALLIALLLNPILSYRFLPTRVSEEENWLMRQLHRVYETVLDRTLTMRRMLLAGVTVLLVATAVVGLRLGGEFLPRLQEGAFVINLIRLAGVSIEESVAYNTRIEAILQEKFPDEVRAVWSRIGTAEVATDPMGTELTDIFIALKPRDEWQKAHTQAELIAAMEHELHDLPGINMIFTQPIELRVNEMVAGIRSDVGIKIIGDDFDELVRLGDQVSLILGAIAGTADLSVEQITGQPMLEVKVLPDELARYGMPTDHVLEMVELLGNVPVGDVFEGQRRFPLTMRLPDEYRTDADAFANMLIPTEAGPLLPLNKVAEVRQTEGPSTINREWGRRLIKVQTNVRDRDVATYVEEAQVRIAREVKLPAGYVIEWGGQFENLERAKWRFMLVVPLTLILIFVLLYFSLKQLRDVLIIYASIPLAAIGGVMALWLRGIPFSVSAAVGFIALSGIAVLNGQVLVSAIRGLLDEGLALGQAVSEAAKQRLRPVLATAITDAAGFIPMAISSGVGAEVQRPLATVVIGGLVTSTLLTLVVLPALYQMFGREGDKHIAG